MEIQGIETHEFHVTDGEEIEILLKGNVTTGYNWILENLRRDPHKFFDEMPQDIQLQERMNEIKLSFDKLLNNDTGDAKQDLFNSVLHMQIMEGDVIATIKK